MKRNDRADRLAGKATILSGLLLGRFEVLRSCEHKAKDTTLSAWRKEAWKEEVLDDLPGKDGRGPSPIRQTLELFQGQCLANLSQTGWRTYGPFRAHRYRLELN